MVLRAQGSEQKKVYYPYRNNGGHFSIRLAYFSGIRIGVCLEYSSALSTYILLPHGLQEVSRKELSLLKGNGNSEEDESTKKGILF